MGLWKWLKGLFSKVGSFVKKLWALAQPFLQEVLSKTAQNIWASSQDLFIAAVQYVAEQGLPTDEARQKAFKAYLLEKAKDKISQLKDRELNLLREMALAIYKKATEQ
ncbi:MAG: hypothetical protein C4540_04525 [Candidatus Omnitrophota bacterium]|jgi:hypothetical protein|nr:MAG: hypothetical protein C4540_04525 [Candidatus Omnitrophota bacterium]